jgi:hypothetical protein
MISENPSNFISGDVSELAKIKDSIISYEEAVKKGLITPIPIVFKNIEKGVSKHFKQDDPTLKKKTKPRNQQQLNLF